MLSKIKIKNYALINELEVEFNKGFLAITGETGAGKSIILGALGLTLGERVDSSVLSNSDTKCVIETWFQISQLNLEQFFVTHELDYESESILRREILPSGKSRAFVNDTPVSLSILKKLSEKLIDVHSQHQTLLLNTNEYQLSIVDANAKNIELKSQFGEVYRSYKSISKEVSELKEKEAKLKTDLDYFQFQFDELDSLNLDSIDEDGIKEELDLLNNAESIKQSFNKSYELFDNELGIISQLKQVESGLSSVANSSKKLEELYERFNSVLIEIEDIKSEIETTNEDIVFDESGIEELTDKVNGLFSVHQKHRTSSIQELIEVRDRIESNLLLASNFDTEIEKLEKEKETILSNLKMIGERLSESRLKVFPKIEKSINQMLGGLGMPNAELQLSRQEVSEIQSNGIDAIQFLFKANKGGTFQPISKVASGGELSRLMLCIKTNLAQKKKLPTLIFDEIDTGVSGDIADKMAELMMKNISVSSQVISITHLPQIASKGDTHYKVYKITVEESTFTKMKTLDKESRVVELAKMLSGSSVSDAALENAKALLSN
ncbi:MAG: DNA repair protein RecN [Flavobacteriales bacterium]